MHSGREQPPCVRIADYRVVRALAGCGRHCATLIYQQTNGFQPLRDRILERLLLAGDSFSYAFQYSGIAIFLCLFPWRRPSRGVRTT